MRHLLINDCVFQWYTDRGLDNYGNPVKEWETYLEVPGRISYPKGRQLERDTEIVPVEAVLFVEDVEVTEHDRVYVDDVLYEILFVARYQDSQNYHHRELSLKRIIQ